MPYFKDKTNALHFLDDAAFAHLLPEGSVEITQAEADALRAPTLTEAKARAWWAIKAERDRRKVGGVKVGEKWFHSDDASRIQQLALVMMGSSIPAGLKWKTMDGSFVDMTQTLAQQIFTAQATNDQEIFSVAEEHRVAMELSDEPSEYDFSAGWPAFFAE
jgi:hypothetical protein